MVGAGALLSACEVSSQWNQALHALQVADRGWGSEQGWIFRWLSPNGGCLTDHHRKTIGKWWFNGIFNGIYPLANIALERSTILMGNPLNGDFP